MSTYLNWKVDPAGLAVPVKLVLTGVLPPKLIGVTVLPADGLAIPAPKLNPEVGAAGC